MAIAEACGAGPQGLMQRKCVNGRETWYNNVRWRSGHRVVGRGPGGRKMKDVRQHDMFQKFVATNLNLSSRDGDFP